MKSKKLSNLGFFIVFLSFVMGTFIFFKQQKTFEEYKEFFKTLKEEKKDDSKFDDLSPKNDKKGLLPLKYF
tara:strand:+ start:207 stop:419 length:213 start_codon:yes stop_codon:yes gene_type:complete